METLYNHFPFLKKVNDRFKKPIAKQNKTSKTSKTSPTRPTGKNNQPNQPTKEEKALPKNKNSYETELALLPDTTFTVTHNKKSKRLIVTAKTPEGRSYPIKYKVVDQNKIVIKGRDSLKVKVTVTAKPPTENEWWYKPAQSAARFLMMVRTIGISYRNQYAMSLPGFMPS